jgi:hypothetical protein
MPRSHDRPISQVLSHDVATHTIGVHCRVDPARNPCPITALRPTLNLVLHPTQYMVLEDGPCWLAKTSVCCFAPAAAEFSPLIEVALGYVK